MKVHIIIPYDPIDKNLGRAYNEAMAQIPDGDCACLLDYDIHFLTPDCGKIIHDYANYLCDDNHLLTCYTNRVHPASKMQLLNGHLTDDSDIRNHISLAENQKRQLYTADPITSNISGFLMVMTKEFWKTLPFADNLKCLGVDTNYSIIMRENGRKVLRMNGLYVFHTYRMANESIMDKHHLY